MKTVKFLLAGLFFLLSFFANGQRPLDSRLADQKTLEQIRNEKWAFLIEKSELTAKEIDAVLPIFIAYENAHWNLHQKSRAMLRQARKNREENKEINYSKINSDYINYEIKQANLLKKYHLDLCEVLSQKSLYNYYRAERAFKRNLLSEISPQQK